MAKAYKTIKQCAQDLLLRINYVDIDGRNVGFDYRYILDEIKVHFPTSRTSRKELQKIAYAMNADGLRLPARKRSRAIMAREYAQALAVKGLVAYYPSLRRKVLARFPGCGDALPTERGLNTYVDHRRKERML